MASTRNVSSKLLTPQENETFFSLIGNRSASVATAVAQVYFYENGWNKKYCGVTSFVKDNEKRSYFIRIFDLQSGRMLWEQELYNQFKYDTPESFFHMFATDHCWAGLNFADEVEANGFKRVINDKIQRRQQRRQEKRRPAPSTPNPAPTPQNVQAPSHATQQGGPQSSANSKRRASSSSKDDKKKDKSGGRKKLTKADIGLPSGFKHVSHVGWDPEKGFNVDEMDPQVKGWFNTIGVSDDQLKDQNTAKFIRNFIDQHGGLDALKEDAERLGEDFIQSLGGNPMAALGGGRGSSAPPPPPPSRGSHIPPPPPPSRTPGPPLPNRPPAPPPPGNTRGPPPPAPPPSRGYPSAPPTSRGLPPPPPPQSQYNAPPAPPPTRPMTSAPPPPPPPPSAPMPPPMNGSVPPPPPPPPSAPMGGSGGGSAGRGGLLDQIHQGTTLKKVDPSENPKPAPTGRGALLDQIRGGYNLKKVTHVEKEESPVSTPNTGLGAALFQALQHRANAIQDEPDGSDSEEFDEDEWDED
ncbi:neural Wiskott-Aldrich syndrome protein-like isoform X2 [Lytechinus variegatus]|uniref:neural Wiskott-Aldrich syndrome protein-like isoform X2 n=1 Tax=Lytechinus variegatus TaxID=7654 RepID=UPI001BB21436|nr:neural Wiskott-Aldrich syndrome protein-like isoform X2 [Lytechinus variegatus]